MPRIRHAVMKIYDFIFHVSLSAEQMCRVFTWTVRFRSPPAHPDRLAESIVPLHNLHFYCRAARHINRDCSVNCVWGDDAKHIQLKVAIAIVALFQQKKTSFLCDDSWKFSRLISPVIYGWGELVVMTMVNPTHHASAAFIASNSFNFISRLISWNSFSTLFDDDDNDNQIELRLFLTSSTDARFLHSQALTALPNCWQCSPNRVEIIIQMTTTGRSLIDGEIIQLGNLS